MVKVYPRPIDLENRDKLGRFAGVDDGRHARRTRRRRSRGGAPNSGMSERLLFITGRLAKPRLESVLARMAPPFAYEVLDIGVKVAALMTEPILLQPPAAPA